MGSLDKDIDIVAAIKYIELPSIVSNVLQIKRSQSGSYKYDKTPLLDRFIRGLTM